jgi:hypothetical protein
MVTRLNIGFFVSAAVVVALVSIVSSANAVPTAVPITVTGPDLVFQWTPADPTDHSYSGTITISGLDLGAGYARTAGSGAIVTYDIMTPIGAFTSANSVIMSPASNLMAWDSGEITSLYLIFTLDDVAHHHLIATQGSIALAVDPPGTWTAVPKANLPENSETLALLVLGVGTLAAVGRVTRHSALSTSSN